MWWVAVACALEVRGPVVEGQPVTIAVEQGPVHITYRPNTVVEETVVLPVVDGQVVWTPSTPGVVRLEAGEESTTVAVRFAGIPWSGVGVMLAAGSLLFGGMVLSLVLLLRGRDEGLVVGSPLDT